MRINISSYSSTIIDRSIEQKLNADKDIRSISEIEKELQTLKNSAPNHPGSDPGAAQDWRLGQ